MLFAIGIARFGPDQRASLEAIAGYLESYPQVERLRIEGHADDVGSEEDNLALSVARARTVADWLIARGVARERLEISGCSERYPAEPEGDAGDGTRRHNRRVELFVTVPESGTRPHAECRVSRP